VANNPNNLWVEDHDTKGVVIGLMRHHIHWPRDEDEDKWPVKIEVQQGVDNVLDKKALVLSLKNTELVALGLIVDADSSFSSRWDRIRNICLGLGGAPSENFPPDGLILDIAGKRLGVWIMPDNKSDGMLENFCHALVPEDGKPLLDYARRCLDDAKALGASYKPDQVEKAHIHTWLAWQNPPGLRIGMALTKKILTPHSQTAKRFVSWFKELFQV